MTKKIKTTTLAVIALLTLGLTGCRTTRQTESVALSKKQRTELIAPLAQYPDEVKTLSTRATIALNYNGLSATVKGRLRMRRDESIQISITALGLMEIANIELTPKGAYIIDRVNKRYALLDYSSGLLSNIGINFSTMQALFWNRLFIPGEKNVWNNAGDFALNMTGTQCLIEPNRQRILKCKFYTDADCKQLQQTDLSLPHYTATWRYSQLETTDTYRYPTMHDVSINDATYAMGARIGLTEISTLDTGWKGSTDLTRYKKVDLEQLLSIIEMIR